MKTIGRVLAVFVITISVLSMILALVSIVSIWRYNGPLIQSLVLENEAQSLRWLNASLALHY